MNSNNDLNNIKKNQNIVNLFKLRHSWWKVMDTNIGIIPLPIYILLVLLIWAFTSIGKLPGEICMAIAILAVGGFTCAEIGKRIPFIKNFGAGAIFATFIPSYLAFNHVLPDSVLTVVTNFTVSTNFLYLFISSIIVGSILSMDREVLIKGFFKIFVPLAAGTILAGLVGTLVGTLLGLGSYHTFFFLVVPIMAGGVGEGAIPLSIGYSNILHLNQGDVFAQVLPPIMMGSLMAILTAGGLNFLGKRFPKLTGEGRIQPHEKDDANLREPIKPAHEIDVHNVAAAGTTSIALYLSGLLMHRLFEMPAPVVMLFLAVIVKLTFAVSPRLISGSYFVYKFFSTAVTYPLLFAIGMAMTPWDKLVSAFTIVNIITIASTVVTLITTGFFVGRWLGMYPIEAAVINACHSGQGGTGDVAILTAANRMTLMPFAQIATRIGGALTVTITLLVLSRVTG